MGVLSLFTGSTRRPLRLAFGPASLSGTGGFLVSFWRQGERDGRGGAKTDHANSFTALDTEVRFALAIVGAFETLGIGWQTIGIELVSADFALIAAGSLGASLQRLQVTSLDELDTLARHVMLEDLQVVQLRVVGRHRSTVEG